MAEFDGIPHALQHAHSELVAALAEGIRQQNANFRFSNAREIFDCIENFVEALDKSGGGRELADRAKLIATLCGPDREYAQARRQAWESCKNRPHELTGSQLPIDYSILFFPEPPYLSIVSQVRQQIERILDEPNLGLSSDTRNAFQRLRKVCRNIEKQANGLAVDGCSRLLEIYSVGEGETSIEVQTFKQLRDAASERCSLLGCMLEDIKAAADSMVGWVKRNAESVKNFVRDMKERLLTASPAQPAWLPRGRETSEWPTEPTPAEALKWVESTLEGLNGLLELAKTPECPQGLIDSDAIYEGARGCRETRDARRLAKALILAGINISLPDMECSSCDEAIQTIDKLHVELISAAHVCSSEGRQTGTVVTNSSNAVAALRFSLQKIIDAIDSYLMGDKKYPPLLSDSVNESRGYLESLDFGFHGKSLDSLWRDANSSYSPDASEAAKDSFHLCLLFVLKKAQECLQLLGEAAYANVTDGDDPQGPKRTGKWAKLLQVYDEERKSDRTAEEVVVRQKAVDRYNKAFKGKKRPKGKGKYEEANRGILTRELGR